MKITRNALRKLIMEVLEMGQDLGVQNLSDKGVEKGTPIVRGDRGTGGYYKGTGEKIALNKKLVIVAPSANWIGKTWPIQNFCSLLKIVFKSLYK